MRSPRTTIFVILVGTVHSYLLRSRTWVAGLQSQRPNQRWNPRRSASNDDTNDNTNGPKTSNPKWELMEDWVLQDKVPEFTVGGTTFWRQLKHTIPELSTRTEQELQQRYNQLETNNLEDQNEALLRCGDSPEVLNTWWMDVVQKNQNSAAIMMIHGRLSNGSNIWFPLQSAGTIGGGTQTTNDSSSFRWLLEDGDYTKYVESSAGCIYELGTPKPNSMDTLFDSTSDDNIMGFDASKDMLSWSTNNVGTTVSAVIASSVLSAALAFNLGQASLPAPAPFASVS